MSPPGQEPNRYFLRHTFRRATASQACLAVQSAHFCCWWHTRGAIFLPETDKPEDLIGLLPKHTHKGPFDSRSFSYPSSRQRERGIIQKKISYPRPQHLRFINGKAISMIYPFCSYCCNTPSVGHMGVRIWNQINNAPPRYGPHLICVRDAICSRKWK